MMISVSATDPFTLLEPQHQEIGVFYVLLKRRATYSEAQSVERVGRFLILRHDAKSERLAVFPCRWENKCVHRALLIKVLAG